MENDCAKKTRVCSGQALLLVERLSGGPADRPSANPLAIGKQGGIIQMRVVIERAESKPVARIKKLTPGTITRHPTTLPRMLRSEVQSALHCDSNGGSRRDSRNPFAAAAICQNL